MNREIKFRGKDIETDEWVEGSYAHISGRHIIFTEKSIAEGFTLYMPAYLGADP